MAALPSATTLDPGAVGATGWRTKQRAELSASMVWVSHILVRHRNVQPRKMSFSPSLWNGAPPAPQRSPEEARALIESVATAAQAAPGNFADLARRWSEDIATAPWGGSLGGTRLDRLVLWPNVLDALDAMPVGGVSAVIETPYGFHILQKRAAPPEEVVSGERIVIGHDDAPWLSRYLARGVVPRRTHAEATALAQHVYELARRTPEAFHDLVQTYSEHRDAARAGDFGAWSTREPCPFPQAVEVLQSLRVGQVAPPMESLYGIEIVKRAPDRPRQRYAASWVRVKFGEPSSTTREAALQTSGALLEQLRQHTVTFARLGERYPVKDAISWWQGREAPAIESALAELAIGDLVTRPIESGNSFLIARRLAPDGVEPSLAE